MFQAFDFQSSNKFILRVFASVLTAFMEKQIFGWGGGCY